MNEDKCKKCKGTGYLKTYIHVEGGRCYRCGGTGKESSYEKAKADREYRNSSEGKAAYRKYLEETKNSTSLY